jgi:diketogulonate reductase-like aldo/keto reductase
MKTQTTFNPPPCFYGTAWKEDRTTDLTVQALKCGFRAIDTANQRKHYFEAAVGEAVADFLHSNSISRSELFLQTKFTYTDGQDHRKPYNEDDSFTKQVEDSATSSLEHLQTNYIDCYVLHGPFDWNRWSPEDAETWRAMERLHSQGLVKNLGVSNVRPEHLIELLKFAKVPPVLVQNRCFARTGWDHSVREICQRHDVRYQGFSLLTANQKELSNPAVVTLAKKYQKTIPQVVFRFANQMGMIYLSGTTQSQHMKQDLEIFDFELSPAELEFILNIG